MSPAGEHKPKVVVVMPAYNAARTLRMTYAELPHDVVDLVILVDDGSSDETIQIARELGLELFVHNRNYGYGANQKTCYREALRAGADIIVMVHPDYQYDPTLLPEVIAPIQRGTADVVLGSRLLGGRVMEQGMPWWKFVANRILTTLNNAMMGVWLSEYHSGFRIYSARWAKGLPLDAFSDDFKLGFQLISQAVIDGWRLGEVSGFCRYFPEASQNPFRGSVVYGWGTLTESFRVFKHRLGLGPARVSPT